MEIIAMMAQECRTLLDIAIRATGCGVNPSKSELIVPTRYTDCHDMAKDEFVWLGYSLKLCDDNSIRFTDQKMIARFKKSL